MNTITIINRIKVITLTLGPVSAFWVFAMTDSHAQGQSPADSYYNRQIGQTAPGSELPSESYYKNHLRAGGDEWDEDDGPGGSGSGGNDPVGVPVGGSAVGMATTAAAYMVLLFYRKRKKNQC